MLMTKAVQEGRLDIVEYLLDTGMEPDREKALLHEAVKNDDLPMVQAVGPFYDASGRDINGDAPLHIVRSRPVAEWLMKNGARVDEQDKNGRFPYETVQDEELAAWLEQEYLALHPRVEEEFLPAVPAEIPWDSRFVTRTLSIDELKPVSASSGLGFLLEYEGEHLAPSSRFIESFAKRLKFSSNIFRLFSVTIPGVASQGNFVPRNFGRKFILQAVCFNENTVVFNFQFPHFFGLLFPLLPQTQIAFGNQRYRLFSFLTVNAVRKLFCSFLRRNYQMVHLKIPRSFIRIPIFFCVRK